MHIAPPLLQTTARLDTAGIAALLGCTRAHVTDRLSKRPDFPKPFINVSQKMRYWRLSDIQNFIAGKQTGEKNSNMR
ncbi:MAG: hypothetical protein EOP24_26600 [Hyphomicrobiales bacterium]|nr:MAG: hypothetical protein EOP24_26600 [Hyphomicrobiales bacterium]